MIDTSICNYKSLVAILRECETNIMLSSNRWAAEGYGSEEFTEPGKDSLMMSELYDKIYDMLYEFLNLKIEKQYHPDFSDWEPKIVLCGSAPIPFYIREDKFRHRLMFDAQHNKEVAEDLFYLCMTGEDEYFERLKRYGFKREPLKCYIGLSEWPSAIFIKEHPNWREEGYTNAYLVALDRKANLKHD